MGGRINKKQALLQREPTRCQITSGRWWIGHEKRDPQKGQAACLGKKQGQDLDVRDLLHGYPTEHPVVTSILLAGRDHERDLCALRISPRRIPSVRVILLVGRVWDRKTRARTEDDKGRGRVEKVTDSQSRPEPSRQIRR